jgi:putative ABC transport system ATP-binding protein
MIKLQNVYKTYQIGEHQVHALDGINVKIEDGELISIMGASGSGKTTMMNILGLLDRPTSGHYYLKNKEVSKLNRNDLAYLRNRTIGFIFQQFFLFPRWNALQNVMLPLVYRDTPLGEMKKRALESLARVGMAEFINHKPSELSGGQQQRVAIARALVGHPAVILADEPTGSLDSKTGQDVMNLLIELNQKEKATIIIVTHDNNVAKQCSRIIRISDGKIIDG